MEELDYRPTTLKFSRVKDDDVMDVSVTYQGEWTEKAIHLSILDGVMEGLTGIILHDLKVKTKEDIDIEAFEKGWESIFDDLKGHSIIHTRVKEYTTSPEWDETEEVPNLETLLISVAGSPVVYHEELQLWSEGETFLEFNNQIGVGYHKLVLEGTLTGVRESLIYLLFFLLLNEFNIDNEHDLLPTLEKIFKIEVKRTAKHQTNDSSFGKYMQPWLNALQKLG